VTASELVDALRDELSATEEAIREHRYLDALEDSQLGRDDLKLFAAAQTAIIASDRASFLRLAARYPWEAAGQFFLELADGEATAAHHLAAFCVALELGPAELAALEPPAGCYAYPSFVAWLSTNGDAASTAIAFLANLRAWGANCKRMSVALQELYELDEQATGFFTFFAEPAPAFEEAALAVAAEGFARGEPEVAARRAARLLQAYELQYWDTLADAAAL
jgi:thiaminase